MTGFLASYWYYKNRDFGSKVTAGPVILDSGAFSAFTQGGSVSIPELLRFYARVKDEIGDELAWTISLDVMGDAAGSYRNWLEMRDRGAADVVPVVHFTSPLPFEEQVAPYLEAGATRVCFGGTVGGTPALINAWAAHGLRWMRDNSPETLTHGLGVGPWTTRARLPWDSTDCSDFGLAYRYGKAYLPHPQRGTKFEVLIGTGRPPTPSVAQVIRAYGVEPRDCTSRDPLTRTRALAQLSFRAGEHEEELTNRRRAAASPVIRPVTRFAVTNDPKGEIVVFEEMARARAEGPYVPRRVPGLVRVGAGKP